MRKNNLHLIVRSRNITCAPLRELVVPRPTILRLGSTTPTNKITKCKNPKEINTAEACNISGNKILMKEAFKLGNIPIAESKVVTSLDEALELLQEYKKIICKHIHSSKGKGIYLFEDALTLQNWAKTHNFKYYIFERYYNYSREYRIHVTKHGCFYACRKMLKNDAEVRWHRHSDNCIWLLEEHEMFNKPSNWEDIVNDCVKALHSIGLDIAAFDVKVQSSKKKCPKYIILESNSAPSLGEIGLHKYKEELTRLINEQELLNA